MFQLKVDLWKECVMSVQLFNLLMDGMQREVNAWVLDRRAGFQFVGGVWAWEVRQLLFADDIMLLACFDRETAEDCVLRLLKHVKG